MIVALGVVAATWMVRHPTDRTRSRPNREPSSSAPGLRMESSKQTRLDEFSSAASVGKASANFSVVIRGDGFAETSMRLTGKVTADRPLRGHEYSWILPEGYIASTGSLTGSLPDLEAGQTHEVSIDVDRSGAAPHPIVLHVFKLVNSEARGLVAQFDFPTAGKALDSASQPEPQKQNRKFDPEPSYVQ